MRDPIEGYFATLRDIHASGAGVAETSYYAPLAELLSALGSKLKPKVSAIINLRNTGGGIPDGGLFTAPQLKGWELGTDPLAGQLPARGAIEVKSPAEDAFVTAEGEQVVRYVERYGLVLVTNLRDFVLVGRSADRRARTDAARARRQLRAREGRRVGVGEVGPRLVLTRPGCEV